MLVNMHQKVSNVTMELQPNIDFFKRTEALGIRLGSTYIWSSDWLYV